MKWAIQCSKIPLIAFICLQNEPPKLDNKKFCTNYELCGNLDFSKSTPLKSPKSTNSKIFIFKMYSKCRFSKTFQNIDFENRMKLLDEKYITLSCHHATSHYHVITDCWLQPQSVNQHPLVIRPSDRQSQLPTCSPFASCQQVIVQPSSTNPSRMCHDTKNSNFFDKYIPNPFCL